MGGGLKMAVGGLATGSDLTKIFGLMLGGKVGRGEMGARSRMRAPRFFGVGEVGGGGKILKEYKSARENVGREILSRIGGRGDLMNNNEGYRLHCMVKGGEGGGRSWWRRGGGWGKVERILVVTGKRVLLVRRQEGSGDAEMEWEVKLDKIVGVDRVGLEVSILHVGGRGEGDRGGREDLLGEVGLRIGNRRMEVEEGKEGDDVCEVLKEFGGGRSDDT